MADFVELDDMALQRLVAVGEFPVPATGWVLFGIRGALPEPEEEAPLFAPTLSLRLVELDYDFPRCTLGQWDRDSTTLRAFAGSPVPHISLIRWAKSRGGIGVNQMLEGCVGYRRGPHTPSSGKSYEAFRQASFVGYQRTSDNDVFNRADAIDYSRSREHPGDNIHAAFAMNSSLKYTKASAGCQIVVGTPRRANDPSSADRGSWPIFRNEAYATGQTEFSYILLRGTFVRDVLAADPGTFPVHVRMGSLGPSVALVQEGLLDADYARTPGERYNTDRAHIDEDFGPRTLRSLVDYQRDRGLLEDGVAGPVTAASLDIADWPRA